MKLRIASLMGIIWAYFSTIRGRQKRYHQKWGTIRGWGGEGFVFSVMVSRQGFWGEDDLFWSLRYGNYDGIFGGR